MVDEEKKNVEQPQKPEQKGQPAQQQVQAEEAQPEQQEQYEEPQAQVDDSALDEIKAQLAELNTLKQETQQYKEKADKLDAVTSALTGKKQVSEAEKEQFFRSLADNPDETLKKKFNELSSSEINDVKQELQELKLQRQDQQIMQQINASNPDASEVWKNIPKYVSEDEYNKYRNDSNRTEILFSLAQYRMNNANKSRKEKETNAEREAKKDINKTSISAKPSGSGDIDTKTSEDERRERIEKAKQNFDVDSTLDEVLDGDWEMLWNKRANQ